MSRYLLDTNHLGETLRAGSVVRDRIQQLHRLGDVFGTTVPILCELWVGINLRKDISHCRQRLELMSAVLKFWPLEPTIAESYGLLYHQLKSVGRALSQVDILSAAFCLQNNVTLLTSDLDFQAISELKSENWLADDGV